jgi:hypothetical protein
MGFRGRRNQHTTAESNSMPVNLLTGEQYAHRPEDYMTKAITGVSDRQFDAMRKMGNDTPWLMKTKQGGTRESNGNFVGHAGGPDEREYVAVFSPGKTSDNLREATAAEIAMGKFYANYDEYLSDHPGVRPVAA